MVTLSRADLPSLRRLFTADVLAGDFFHPGLLDTGFYLGRRRAGELVAVAGVHVVAPDEGVAALGNVVTHPAHRRSGHARAVVATLCHRLRGTVDVVGLNVRADNHAAAALYTALGFQELVPFEEGVFARPS